LLSVLGWLTSLGPRSGFRPPCWLRLPFYLGVKVRAILLAVPRLGPGTTGLSATVRRLVRAVGRVI
jgi:hypothetical protein